MRTDKLLATHCTGPLKTDSYTAPPLPDQSGDLLKAAVPTTPSSGETGNLLKKAKPPSPSKNPTFTLVGRYTFRQLVGDCFKLCN